jgi:leucyl/phenylalanyl-tRNA--protein transferase
MYILDEEQLSFPHPKYASAEGLLAVGGDLSVERLVLAYQNGIFPWYNPDEPILWWSPAPRFVLLPSEVYVSKSMRQVLKRKIFEFRYDTAFNEVLEACASIPRREQEGTWLSDDMRQAYLQLHQLGIAHSVEAWQDGKLVGGLYGVGLGKCFFGESMFAKVSNGSKACLIHLARHLEHKGYWLMDCQVHTDHLESMGAKMMRQDTFLDYLQRNKQYGVTQEDWKKWELMTVLK